MVFRTIQDLLQAYLFPHMQKMDFYKPVNPQTSWAKRPQHITLSSTFWMDLLMVGILFRLNEFALAHLATGVIGCWLPIAVFFAVYDTWEFRVIFDSLFRFDDDVVHTFLAVLTWFLVAIMATTITPLRVWGNFEVLLFSSAKVAHAGIRFLHYLETTLFSPSRRARRAAFHRTIIFGASLPFYLAAPCALHAEVLNADQVASFWVCGFFLQRLIWLVFNSNKRIQIEFRQVKCNVPFVEQRIQDWLMLQLGAIILGFVTVPVVGLEGYGTLIFAYIYVANLNLLNYASIPEKPEDHAIYRGGIYDFVWTDLNNVIGLTMIGITVGLRVHLFYEKEVVEAANRHYTWILCLCASANTVCLLIQDLCHGGTVARWNGGKMWFLKLFVALLYVLLGGVFIASESHTVSFLVLGMALISSIYLFVQIANGAFRKHIANQKRVVLMGYFRAAIVGTVLLHRARRNLIKRAFTEGNSSVEISTRSINTGEDGSESGSSTDRSRKRRASLDLAKRMVNEAKKDAKRILSVARADAKQLGSFIGSHFYEKPTPFVEGHKLMKYKVQWSDLFFDILYVAMVFRLGDLLLSGVGGGYAETSVHYLVDLGVQPINATYPPNDPATPEAIFIFGAVFVAAWSMWQSKLAYSSKIGNSDVFHKLVDMLQGFIVLICAVNITTPRQLQDKHNGNAYAIAASLLAFQITNISLWAEVRYHSQDERVKGSAQRNFFRDGLAVFPLAFSFLSISLDAGLWVTCFLWALHWFLPFAVRVYFFNFLNSKNSVRDLHRYVIHRLGDGALIVLGEGVLQIVRTETKPTWDHYVGVTVGFFLMTAIRIAVFSMDCFKEPEKHAQFLSLDAGLGAFFVRSIAAPALVACGVGIKKLVSISSPQYQKKYEHFYWLLCGASVISLAMLVFTYELHRFAMKREVRKYGLAVGMLVSLLFLFWPWVSVVVWVELLLIMGVWLLSILIHSLTDDYYNKVKKRAVSMSHVHMGLKRETVENDVGMWKTLLNAFTMERRKSTEAPSPRHHQVDHSLDTPQVVAVVSSIPPVVHGSNNNNNNSMIVASTNPVFVAAEVSPPPKRNSLQAQKEEDEEERERRPSSHRLSLVNDEVRRKSNPIYADIAQHVERKESIV